MLHSVTVTDEGIELEEKTTGLDCRRRELEKVLESSAWEGDISALWVKMNGPLRMEVR